MSQAELAEAAKVGEFAVKDFEFGKRRPIEATQMAMRAVLERAGIGFPFATEGGVSYACGITYSEPAKASEQ